MIAGLRRLFASLAGLIAGLRRLFASLAGLIARLRRLLAQLAFWGSSGLAVAHSIFRRLLAWRVRRRGQLFPGGGAGRRVGRVVRRNLGIVEGLLGLGLVVACKRVCRGRVGVVGRLIGSGWVVWRVLLRGIRFLARHFEYLVERTLLVGSRRGGLFRLGNFLPEVFQALGGFGLGGGGRQQQVGYLRESGLRPLRTIDHGHTDPQDAALAGRQPGQAKNALARPNPVLAAGQREFLVMRHVVVIRVQNKGLANPMIVGSRGFNMDLGSPRPDRGAVQRIEQRYLGRLIAHAPHLVGAVLLDALPGTLPEEAENVVVHQGDLAAMIALRADRGQCDLAVNVAAETLRRQRAGAAQQPEHQGRPLRGLQGELVRLDGLDQDAVETVNVNAFKRQGLARDDVESHWLRTPALGLNAQREVGGLRPRRAPIGAVGPELQGKRLGLARPRQQQRCAALEFPVETQFHGDFLVRGQPSFFGGERGDPQRQHRA